MATFREDKINNLLENQPDVFCFAETWIELPTTIFDRLSKIYQLFQINATKHHIKGRAIGGMLLGIMKPIDNEILQLHPNFAVIKTNTSPTTKIILIFCYIPHEENPIDYIKTFQTHFSHILIVVLGDFNCRIGEMDYENHVLSEILHNQDKIHNKKGVKLLKRLHTLDLHILNGRTNGDLNGKYSYISTLGNSTIDLGFCSHNILNTINSFKVHSWMESDHFPISIKFEDTQPSKPSMKFEKLVWDSNKTQISGRLLVIEIAKSSEAKMNNLNKCVWEAPKKCELVKTVVTYQTPRPKSCPWFDEECKTAKKTMKISLKNLRKPWRTAKEKTQDACEYISLKKIYKSTRMTKRIQPFEKIQLIILNAKNGSDFWDAMRIYRSKKEFLQNSISNQDWKKYFSDVFKKEEYTDSPAIQLPEEIKVTELDSPFTYIELNKAIKNLATSKAPGSDGIPNEIWKSLTVEVKKKLLDTFNTLFEDHNFDKSWSEIIIMPIFKKGNKEEPKNYRPISLLNTSLKLFTQLIGNRLLTWCEKNNKISKYQGGSRKKRGCVDQIFIFNSVIHKQVLQHNRKLYSVFVDLSGAFEPVDRQILWSKLKKKVSVQK